MQPGRLHAPCSRVRKLKIAIICGLCLFSFASLKPPAEKLHGSKYSTQNTVFCSGFLCSQKLKKEALCFLPLWITQISISCSNGANAWLKCPVQNIDLTKQCLFSLFSASFSFLQIPANRKQLYGPKCIWYRCIFCSRLLFNLNMSKKTVIP